MFRCNLKKETLQIGDRIASTHLNTSLEICGHICQKSRNGKFSNICDVITITIVTIIITIMMLIIFMKMIIIFTIPGL